MLTADRPSHAATENNRAGLFEEKWRATEVCIRERGEARFEKFAHASA
jgi:hypothetical protein